MAKSSETPLMKQYNEIKDNYPNTILFFRLGDFFETFGDDAVVTAKVCGITLTKRNNGAAGDMPLAGFPHHQLEAYLPKLVRAGYRVAVCEQLEDPKFARGIVKRGVVEVVTPGVALYDKLLDTGKNNYVVSIYAENILDFENSIIGLSGADISTGEFFCMEIHSSMLADTLESLMPSEVLISKNQKLQFENFFNEFNHKPAITKLEDWIFELDFTREALLRHFKTQSLKGFGIEESKYVIIASGVVLHYINETQKIKLEHIRNLIFQNPSEYMLLDHSTRKNLEITYSLNDNQKASTLISILDKTSTAFGARLFKKWIARPLKDLTKINTRLDATQALYNAFDKLQLLRKEMSEIADLERLISKISTGKANPRDVLSLRNSLIKIPKIQEILNEIDDKSIKYLNNKLHQLANISDMISNALNDDAPVQIGTGELFKFGYDKILDSYVEAKFSGKNWVSDYQNMQRERTGISSLKVGFNNVFGYYIEISKVNAAKAPEDFERKQTLANGERYTTPELREIEQKILGAEENIGLLETRLFNEIKLNIALETEKIQQNANYLAQLDCLMSFAFVALEYNYVKPIIDDSDKIEIKEGRHPVVEKLLALGESFVANDTILDCTNEQIHILTGPNMAGKSCYLRQVALIVLLGQIGSFVPAKYARFGLIDRIFTRVGAQDNISAGESTFLVEMQEAANIINNATNKSLILLDEVGRGTATFDGVSIAWSIAEYIHDNIGAKTLFATHYHELNDLNSRYERIVNYKVEVIETTNKIIFTHKVLPGTSDHSFGIHVAQMAGMPKELTERANQIMRGLEQENDAKPELNLESNSENSSDNIQNAKEQEAKPKLKKTNISNIKTKEKAGQNQYALFTFQDDSIREKVLELKIENITPINALQILSELQNEAKKQ